MTQINCCFMRPPREEEEEVDVFVAVDQVASNCILHAITSGGWGFCHQIKHTMILVNKYVCSTSGT